MVWGCTFSPVDICNENDVMLDISSHLVDPSLSHKILLQMD